jgi:hypothetical protein
VRHLQLCVIWGSWGHQTKARSFLPSPNPPEAPLSLARWPVLLLLASCGTDIPSTCVPVVVTVGLLWAGGRGEQEQSELKTLKLPRV